jgi:hypothetical protein
MKALVIVFTCLAYLSALGGILLWLGAGIGNVTNTDLALSAPFAGLALWWVSTVLANLLAARYATPHTRQRTTFSILTAIALLLPPLLAYIAPLRFALERGAAISSASGATLPASASGGVNILNLGHDLPACGAGAV